MNFYSLEEAFPGLAPGRPTVPAGSLPNCGHYTGETLTGASACVSVAPTVGALSRRLIADGGNPEGAYHMAAGIRPGNNTPDLGLVACPEYNGYCVPPEAGPQGPAPTPVPISALDWQ